MQKHVAGEGRIGAGRGQGQAEARQAQVGEAGCILQFAAERHRHGLVQVAHQRAGDGAVLALGRQGAIGGQVVGARPDAEVGQGGAARRACRDRGGRHALAQQGRQGGVDLAAARRGDIAHQVIGNAVASDVALSLEQGGVAFVLQIQRPALLARDAQDVAFQVGHGAAALVGTTRAGLHGDGAEVGLQHEVHDPLIGAVAVGQGGFLGQDLGALDRLGRDAANFAKA